MDDDAAKQLVTSAKNSLINTMVDWAESEPREAIKAYTGYEISIDLPDICLLIILEII